MQFLLNPTTMALSKKQKDLSTLITDIFFFGPMGLMVLSYFFQIQSVQKIWWVLLCIPLIAMSLNELITEEVLAGGPGIHLKKGERGYYVFLVAHFIIAFGLLTAIIAYRNSR